MPLWEYEMWTITRLRMVIISQHIEIANHYVVNLKSILPLYLCFLRKNFLSCLWNNKLLELLFLANQDITSYQSLFLWTSAPLGSFAYNLVLCAVSTTYNSFKLYYFFPKFFEMEMNSFHCNFGAPPLALEIKHSSSNPMEVIWNL